MLSLKPLQCTLCPCPYNLYNLCSLNATAQLNIPFYELTYLIMMNLDPFNQSNTLTQKGFTKITIYFNNSIPTLQNQRLHFNYIYISLLLLQLCRWWWRRWEELPSCPLVGMGMILGWAFGLEMQCTLFWVACQSPDMQALSLSVTSSPPFF